MGFDTPRINRDWKLLTTEQAQELFKKKGGQMIEEGDKRPDIGQVPLSYLVGKKAEHLPPEAQSNLDTLVAACLSFLRAPVLVDTFEKHEYRRRLIKRMERKHAHTFTAFYDNNKLRMALLSSVTLAAQSLASSLGESSGEITCLPQVFAIAETLPKYETYDLQTKMCVVHDMEDFCKEFLDLVAGAKRASPLAQEADAATQAA